MSTPAKVDGPGAVSAAIVEGAPRDVIEDVMNVTKDVMPVRAARDAPRDAPRDVTEDVTEDVMPDATVGLEEEATEVVQEATIEVVQEATVGLEVALGPPHLVFSTPNLVHPTPPRGCSGLGVVRG